MEAFQRWRLGRAALERYGFAEDCFRIGSERIALQGRFVNSFERLQFDLVVLKVECELCGYAWLKSSPG